MRGPGLSPVFSGILVEWVICLSLSVASNLCGNPALQVLRLSKRTSLFTCLFWSLGCTAPVRRPKTASRDCPQVQPECSVSQLCMFVCRGGNCSHKGGLAGRKAHFLNDASHLKAVAGVPGTIIPWVAELKLVTRVITVVYTQGTADCCWRAILGNRCKAFNEGLAMPTCWPLLQVDFFISLRTQ